MNWKLHLLWPLCTLAAVEDARSGTMNVVETVYYESEFIWRYTGISVEEWWTDDHVRYYVADEHTSIYETKLFGFGFQHYGSQILDFEGFTLSLTSGFALDFPSGSGLPVQALYVESNFDGYVTFGPQNAISSWDVTYFDPVAYETLYFRSDPLLIDSSYGSLALVGDPNFFQGAREIYGSQYWGADNAFYFTQPGYWSTSMKRYCWIEEDGNYRGDVTCPDPIPPDNGCGPSGGVPPKCNPLALVPLPSSLVLLATGLVGLGVFRRRERLERS